MSNFNLNIPRPTGNKDKLILSTIILLAGLVLALLFLDLYSEGTDGHSHASQEYSVQARSLILP